MARNSSAPDQNDIPDPNELLPGSILWLSNSNVVNSIPPSQARRTSFPPPARGAYRHPSVILRIVAPSSTTGTVSLPDAENTPPLPIAPPADSHNIEVDVVHVGTHGNLPLSRFESRRYTQFRNLLPLVRSDFVHRGPTLPLRCEARILRTQRARSREQTLARRVEYVDLRQLYTVRAGELRHWWRQGCRRRGWFRRLRREEFGRLVAELRERGALPEDWRDESWVETPGSDEEISKLEERAGGDEEEMRSHSFEVQAGSSELADSLSTSQTDFSDSNSTAHSSFVAWDFPPELYRTSMGSARESLTEISPEQTAYLIDIPDAKASRKVEDVPADQT